MYFIGTDIGSASSKTVIIDENKNILTSVVIQMGTGSSGPEKSMNSALENLGITIDDAEVIVATGYGRMNSQYTDKQFSEISCHAKGIAHLMPTARTIIDIGGQDAKAIKLEANGMVGQFAMNDKCAAGTGRFLEVMARIMEVPLSEMEKLDAQSTEISPVSSTCTVFAESEVISLLSNKIPKANIVAGIHQSVADRACNLAERVGVRNDVVMSGGVAQNSGVVNAIQRTLGVPVSVAPNPQIIGALGAALYALGIYKKANK